MSACQTRVRVVLDKLIWNCAFSSPARSGKALHWETLQHPQSVSRSDAILDDGIGLVCLLDTDTIRNRFVKWLHPLAQG